MTQKREGIVRWYKVEEGYGRIQIDGDTKNFVFVHFSSIMPDQKRFPTGFRFLKRGQKVSFDLIESPGLSDQSRVAKNVNIISD